MDVVQRPVHLLNPGQVPVLTLDQPLFTITKQIQWNWPDVYGEELFVILLEDRRIMLRTVDSDVLVLAVSSVVLLENTEL